MKRFIVASASPRRRELLSMTGFEFEIIPSDADETLPQNIGAYEAVKELSKRKAVSVWEENKDAVVLGCDTVVALDDIILGKPETEEEAEKMLSTLSGREHCVYSGVCITDGENTRQFVGSARVKFYELSKETIKSYIATKDPMDKAGSYGIQGIGSVLVEKIEGDYFTIVGLPLAKTARVLKEFGVEGKINL